MRKLVWLGFVLGIMVVALPILAQDDTETTIPDDIVTTRAALPDNTQFAVEAVADGFFRPLYLTHAGDGSERIFVMEQAGRVWILDGEGGRMETPFLDIADTVSNDVLNGYSERGLLGLAFHPDYAENGQFYVNYTDREGTTRVVNYAVSADDANVADKDSARLMMSIAQPFANHNGGHLAFGLDGYLYISVGDGGSAGDPLEAAQDPANLLGSILRIDVDNFNFDRPYGIPDSNPFFTNPELAPEVWAWGVRNVWRFSFDRATGDLYLADVGQNQIEEVNFQSVESAGGENYGWDVFEGNEFYEGWQGTTQVEVVAPVAQYTHDLGCSITGGYVYRGEAVPELTAAYLYSDYCSGRIWAAYRDEAGDWQSGVVMNLGVGVSSFGEDENGEVYLINYRDGVILKFMPVEA